MKSKKMKLSIQTQVWRNDFTYWKNITKIEELKNTIFSKPFK